MRGDLYVLKAPKDVRGHEQAGARYAVVVQSDDLPLSTWLIAPASTGCRAASFRPEIEINGTKTRVIVEQLTAIDPQARLGEFAGRLESAEMQSFDLVIPVEVSVGGGWCGGRRTVRRSGEVSAQKDGCGSQLHGLARPVGNWLRHHEPAELRPAAAYQTDFAWSRGRRTESQARLPRRGMLGNRRSDWARLAPDVSPDPRAGPGAAAQAAGSARGAASASQAARAPSTVLCSCPADAPSLDWIDSPLSTVL